MQIHKSKKHLSRKTKKYNITKKNTKKNTKNNTKKNKNHKNQNRKYRKNYKTHTRKMQNQQGGFTNCNLASVKEPGFNIPGLGDIPALSIPDSRGAIYRPNCKTDNYQAMTP
jgi:hypothetical protein